MPPATLDLWEMQRYMNDQDCDGGGFLISQTGKLGQITNGIRIQDTTIISSHFCQMPHAVHPDGHGKEENGQWR